MRSKFEVSIAKKLKELKVPFTYETYSYNYNEALRKNLAKCGDCGSKNLVREGWYTPDFFLGTGWILETKGRFTAHDRRKMLAFKKEHPEEKIAMVFMRNNKLSKQSSTRYSDWCEQNNFDYSINEIKEEWIK